MFFNSCGDTLRTRDSTLLDGDRHLGGGDYVRRASGVLNHNPTEIVIVVKAATEVSNSAQATLDNFGRHHR